jgi:hypothetical protein
MSTGVTTERLFTLGSNEIDLIAESPEALTALIDYHDRQETLAGAIGYVKSARFHEDRASELRRFRVDAETKRAERAGETPSTAVPQPAPDAGGEWRVESEPIHGHRIIDATGRRIVGNIYREEDAVQIVSDRNSVIKLLAALHDARQRIGELETERSA